MESDVEYDGYFYHYDGDNSTPYYDNYMQMWEDYTYPQDIAADSVNIYLPPVLLFIGTVGNFISSIVLAKLSYKSLTTCFYLAFQAVADTLLLYIRCGNTWIRQIAGVDITMAILSRSNTSCQVYSFLSNFLLHLCAWMLVAAVVEVMVVTSKPLKAHTTCTLDRSKNVVLLILLLLVCANAHFFWTYGLEEDFFHHDIFFCTFTTFGNHHSEYFRGVIWPVMDLLFASILPGMIILGCVIYILVSRSRKSSRRQTVKDNAYLLDPIASYQFVTVCLVLGICSLAFTLPEVGYNMFALIFEKMQLNVTEPLFYAYRRLAEALCLSFRDIFLSTKIIVYVITWKAFRRQLMQMCSRAKRDQRVWASVPDSQVRQVTMETNIDVAADGDLDSYTCVYKA